MTTLTPRTQVSNPGDTRCDIRDITTWSAFNLVQDFHRPAQLQIAVIAPPLVVGIEDRDATVGPALHHVEPALPDDRSRISVRPCVLLQPLLSHKRRVRSQFTLSRRATQLAE